MQNSVIEGDLPQGLIHKMIKEIEDIIDKKEDSVIIYTIKGKGELMKQTIGVVKTNDSNFI